MQRFFFFLILVLVEVDVLPASPVDPITPEVVYVEGDLFSMGSTHGEDKEQPVHQVRLSSFYMGKYAVTFSQYEVYYEAEGRFFKPSDELWGREDRPVINVSWNDAVSYCKWLSNETGKKYRLPTEAEWEYAAKGGNKSNDYDYSGGNDLDEVGWYDANSWNKTQPVGQKQPNELGIYDMSGNVWEWCSDYSDSYSRVIQYDPQGPLMGSEHVLRGGSWHDDAMHCRSYSRFSSDPDNAGNDIGFRVVLVP